jgi:hypothetical protein
MHCMSDTNGLMLHKEEQAVPPVNTQNLLGTYTMESNIRAGGNPPSQTHAQKCKTRASHKKIEKAYWNKSSLWANDEMQMIFWGYSVTVFLTTSLDDGQRGPKHVAIYLTLKPYYLLVETKLNKFALKRKWVWVDKQIQRDDEMQILCCSEPGSGRDMEYRNSDQHFTRAQWYDRLLRLSTITK